jgi:hypothetical protein
VSLDAFFSNGFVENNLTNGLKSITVAELELFVFPVPNVCIFAHSGA